MITHKLLSYAIISKRLYYINKVQYKYIQVSVIGAANGIGKNVALLLKQNRYITRLHLYDDDDRVLGMELELGQIPGGPAVSSFSGDAFLPAAIRYSHLVLMLTRTPRKLGYTREKMLATNALAVQRICRTLAYENPDAFFAISSSPINSIVSFASKLLSNYKAYNKHKIFGITHIDTARTRTLLGKTLNVSPHHLHVPVIGGHSDETIIPLFSNLLPSHYYIKQHQAEALTRLVRKSGTEVLNLKQGNDSATLAMAWSINEFVDRISEAFYGSYVIVNSFTANPHFGTKFFSGPTKVSACGIFETCSNFVMSEYESKLLSQAVPLINRDIARGEEHVQVIEDGRNLY
ncbi:unnamed protein product [Euphydryas editha]|uniref:Malate dehydrogenase, mitochondrial n=1 Tax=Euphydryas editha TaxID=104508 RepID=A0AAU9U355_EUPED|nr:unnamed protein product [Euphydryas editha]